MTTTNGARRKGAKAFHCPSCGVYAQQSWHRLAYGSFGRVTRFDGLPGRFVLSLCTSCNRPALWCDDHLVYPSGSSAPPPSTDMPDDVRADFEEARAVLGHSPRAAAALLRLAFHKLILRSGAGNGDAAMLLQKSLPLQIQEALDAVRVVGRHAIPPGLIDHHDDQEAAFGLFELLNIIVDKTITEPRRVRELQGRIHNVSTRGTAEALAIAEGEPFR